MADASEVSVAIESAVHDAFANVAKRIAREHGIRVTRVYFGWAEQLGVGALLVSVNAETETHIPRRGSSV